MSSRISGWGRQFGPGDEVAPDSLTSAPDVPLFRGLGRSYGDSSLPPPGQPQVVSTVRADRVIAFEGRRLHAEAGLALHELNRISLPRNLFVPVTPGTNFVTLGGMVAADVHGKNHHVAGCFGDHVSALTMRLADGKIVRCLPNDPHYGDLFDATIGGMGLTGHILDVEFAMDEIPSPWIKTESERVLDIDQYIVALQKSAREWPMTVGWIDCLSQGANMGRGILMKGRWATAAEAPKRFPREPLRVRFPFEAPEFLLGPLTVRAFNFAYYWKHLPRVMSGITDPSTFFYPLDAVRDWNLMYGKRGMTQYQCVLPTVAGPGAARRFLEVLTRKGGASFLCVIKDCGKQGRGMMSFPMPGMSIALDIAVRDNTQDTIDALNEFVISEGGRIYLAKDSYTRPEHFHAMEAERLEKFTAVRRKYDPKVHFRSAQSIRLMGDPS